MGILMEMKHYEVIPKQLVGTLRVSDGHSQSANFSVQAGGGLSVQVEGSSQFTWFCPRNKNRNSPGHFVLWEAAIVLQKFNSLCVTSLRCGRALVPRVLRPRLQPHGLEKQADDVIRWQNKTTLPTSWRRLHQSDPSSVRLDNFGHKTVLYNKRVLARCQVVQVLLMQVVLNIRQSWAARTVTCAKRVTTGCSDCSQL